MSAKGINNISRFIEVEELSPELFNDVVIYTIAEPGAMGSPCLMEFVKENGECFSFYYGDKFSYSDIRGMFPALEGCFWNGPMPDEKNDGEVVLYTNFDQNYHSITRVANGWKHIYTGYGNHLLVKEEYYSIFRKYISRYERPGEIYCSWKKHIADFVNEITEVEV